jgi:hypothetical protein
MTRHELINQIRYAIRLTQRTAKLYRKIQVCGAFLTIIGGSAIVFKLFEALPPWCGFSGAVLMSIMGAMLVVVRPADKAAQNESDVRRYQTLELRSHGMNDAELEAAIAEARQFDCPEIDPLCDVAYNDVVRSYGREDAVVPLSCLQRLLAALA